MANINIHTYIGNGEMAYDHLYSEGEFQWFKSEMDAYIYVMNTRTERCTRYNAEGQNGKRIPLATFASEIQAMTERTHQKIVDQLEAEQNELTQEQQDAIEATEESETTEEIHEIAQEFLPQPEPKKERKPRAKKLKAGSREFEINGTKVALTEKQIDFMHHLPDTNFWEEGLDSCIWVDVLCDEIGGQFEDKPMTVGAMISTLCEKGLGARGTDRRNGRKCTAFELTEMGKAVAKELGLN